MLLALMPALLDGSRHEKLLFCLPAANQRLRAALEALGSPRLHIRPWRFTKRRGEPYLVPLRRRYAGAVRALAAAERPASILLVQGRIENLAVPMLALPRDLRLVSYVPMAHRLADMGRSGTVGDRVRRRLYRRPDLFVVPGPTVATQIAAAGGVAPVVVVPNVVDPPPPLPCSAARDVLGLPHDRTVALFLGRLEAGQKGLDLLLGAMRRAGAALRDHIFLFVGSGPEAAGLRRAAVDLALDIRQIEWTDRPDLYLSAADILLMPSRWEGVPLVMLEAMTYRVPMLASRIDIFTASLPPANLVDFATVDLAAAMARVLDPAGRNASDEAAAGVLRGRSLETSRALFAAAVAGR